jgi:hypothetical protein
MAAHGWQFLYGPTFIDFSDIVLSFNGFEGRQNYNDNYAGGFFNVTIKNDSNQIANFPRGLDIRIETELGYPIADGVVSNVDFNDYPGNTGLSTATITCIDALSQLGKFQLKDFTGYIETDTITQAEKTNPAYTGWDIPFIQGSNAQSTASAVASYTGTILNRLNLLVQTEKGLLLTGPFIDFLSRSKISNAPMSIAMTRNTVSPTSLKYQDFKRVAAGNNFYNQVTVQPETVAEQQADNSASQTAYGVSGYSISTVDATTTQALGLANWLANMQGDPNTLRYEITFTDVNNNADAFADFFKDYKVDRIAMVSLEWQAQGQSTEVVNTIIEGFSYSGNPSQTAVTVYLSPVEYYQYFILDDNIYGRLGGDGIVYNQPVITYDQSGWIYNDSNADDTASRLGW